MANEFLTVKEIARATLPRLIDNLVMPNLVYKDYSNDFVAGKGAKIIVRKPNILKAEEFNESAGVSMQDIKENGVEVTLDKLATVDVELSAIQSATNIEDLQAQVLAPAAVALAEKINADGLDLYSDIPYVGGTAGTTPSSLEDLAAVRKILNENKVPVTDRAAVWDVESDAKFTTIPAIVNANKSGSTEALRNGSIGRIFGLDNYMSQAVKTHKTGITAATAVKVSAVVAEGATSLGLTGTTLTGKLVKGDILNISGKSYVVTEDSAAAASNAIAAVKVYPALPALTANTEVVLAGSHTANLAFHKQAFAFVTRPLTAPKGVESYTTSFNGISLRVVQGYNMQYKKDMLSIDVLYGYKTLYPELACRYLG